MIDYITSPPRIQRQYPEEWDRAWDVIKENDRDIVKDDENGLMCAVCGKRFDLFHLCFSECIENVKNRARNESLLAAIAEHVDNNQPKVYSVWEASSMSSEDNTSN